MNLLTTFLTIFLITPAHSMCMNFITQFFTSPESPCTETAFHETNEPEDFLSVSFTPYSSEFVRYIRIELTKKQQLFKELANDKKTNTQDLIKLAHAINHEIKALECTRTLINIRNVQQVPESYQFFFEQKLTEAMKIVNLDPKKLYEYLHLEPKTPWQTIQKTITKKIELAEEEHNNLELRRLRQIGGYVFQTTASKEEYDCYLNGTLDSLHKTPGTIAPDNEQELLDLKADLGVLLRRIRDLKLEQPL